MAHIVRTDLADVIGGIAEIAPLDVNRLASDSTDDVFFCALGFEPRCLTLPRRLRGESYQVRRAVYFRYSTNIDDNRANLPALEENLRGLGGTVQSVDADGAEFPNQLRTLLELVIGEATSKTPRVTFDISVTANRLLLRCMKVLLEYDIHLRIVYSEADVYHPTAAEYRDDPEKWETDGLLGLERGVSQILPSFDHPGHALDPLPDLVILFPSFKRERSKAVISAIDPSLLTSPGDKVVWLLGRPHSTENEWRLAAMTTINEISDDAPQYAVSTFHYKETLEILERLHLDRSETNTITLSPLGSKLQALGTALFCYSHPDVRILLSTPDEYNAAQYSEGCRDVWCIDFGSLKDVRRKLDSVGTVRIEE